MANFLKRITLCICILLAGCCSFASTLSDVEILSDGINGKIILNIDKSFVNKKIISPDEIKILLKNTSLKHNMKSVLKNLPDNTDITFLQNGKNTYLNLTSPNISKFEIINAKDGSLLPVRNTSKDAGTGLAVCLIISLLYLFSQKANRQKNHQLPIGYTKKLQQQKNIIRQYNTIRTSENHNSNAIHGNLTANFADSEKMKTVSVPSDLKIANVKEHEQIFEFKKAVNT